MKYVQSDKYNVAWFKLAEYVSRGERERAMGVYRLLHHSLGDKALAAQLKGDLLLCFNENEQAIAKYDEAAQLYKQENKYIESIAVYEHLLFLQPGSKQYLRELLNLYKSIDMPLNMIEHITVLIQEKNFDVAIAITDNMLDLINPVDSYNLRKHIIFGLIERDAESQKIEEQLKIIIEMLTKNKDQSLLQQFLSELQATNKICYDKACQYIAE